MHGDLAFSGTFSLKMFPVWINVFRTFIKGLNLSETDFQLNTAKSYSGDALSLMSI